METRVRIKFVKTAPRKIRLVCDMIRGKKVSEAISQLSFLNKQAAKDVLSALKSAAASAKQKDIKEDLLIIKEIFCDSGPALKRTLLHSRGRSTQFKKRMSHITIILSDNVNSKSEIQNSKQIINSKLKTNSKDNKDNKNNKSQILKKV